MNQIHCEKTRFASQQMARKQAQWIERKGKVMRIYQCTDCHFWHLTSDIYRNKREVHRFREKQFQ